MCEKLKIVFSLVLGFALLQPAILIAETKAYPEARIGFPGEKWRTITARRKGPDNYSSKVIGTPIHIKSGEVIQSVWFLARIIDEYSANEIHQLTAIYPAVIRAGIATEEGFKSNPLASMAEDLSNNIVYNSGVGLSPYKYTDAERQRLSITSIPEMPGFLLIGVELEQLWQASFDQVVYAWSNIEYTNESYLAQVYQFENEAGHDLQVYQTGEVFKLDFTSMIWLEYGDPFLYEANFSINSYGSKQKVISNPSKLTRHKLFAKRPFRFVISGSGGHSAGRSLKLYANIQGTECPTPIVEVKTDLTGMATFEGIAPRVARRRVRFDLELRDGSKVLSDEKVRLIRPNFRKKGRMNSRQKQKMCNSF